MRKHEYNLNLIEYLKIEALKDKLTDMIELRELKILGVQIPKILLMLKGKDKSHYILGLSDINEDGITLDNNSLVELNNGGQV